MYCEAGSTILIFHSIISKFARPGNRRVQNMDPWSKNMDWDHEPSFMDPVFLLPNENEDSWYARLLAHFSMWLYPHFLLHQTWLAWTKVSTAPLLWLLWVFLWVFSLRGGKNRGFMDKGSQFCTLFLETLLYNKTYGIPTFLDTSTFIKLVKSLRHCPN